MDNFQTRPSDFQAYTEILTFDCIYRKKNQKSNIQS